MAGSPQLTLAALLDAVKTNAKLERTCAAMLAELVRIRVALEDDDADPKGSAASSAAIAGAGAELGLGGGLEEAIKEIAAEELGFDPSAAGGMEKGAIKALLKSKIKEQRDTTANGGASNNK